MESNNLKTLFGKLSVRALLIVIPLMMLSVSLMAQKRLDISLKNEPIVKAMTQIEEKTGYKFVYSPSIVELTKKSLCFIYK